MMGLLKRSSARGRNRHFGFTLVELLVVIVVIAILIALLIPAVTSSLNAAKNGRMAVDIGKLQQAVEAYRTEFGGYPPDFAGPDANDLQQINNHLGRMKRYRNKLADGPKAGFVNLDPSEALVFWLWGFSPDPKLPLTGSGGPLGIAPFESQPNALYTFDETRLLDNDGDGYPEYYPQDSDQPYVYLHKDNYVFMTANSIPVATGQMVKPYTRTSPPTVLKDFVESDGFQIICAGQDGKFGATGGVYPDGLGYTDADDDNLTSFSEGSTLQDAIP